MNATKIVATSSALVLLAAVLPGCVDSDAHRRDEIQQTLNQATTDYSSAVASGLDPANDEARKKLRTLSDTLSRIEGGAPGQQVAAALLAASANEALGLMATRQAEQLETINSIDRIVLHSAIDAAGRLDAIALGRDQISDSERLALLDEAQAAARAGLRAASQAAASFDGPIAQLTRENEADSDQVAQLRMQANAQYRRAGELGRLAGLSSFEDATRIRRDAEIIERRMAARENELGYTYQPASDMAVRQAESLKIMVEQIEKARADLQAAGASADQQTAAIRETVAQFKQSIAQTLSQIDSRGAQELGGAYDEGISRFEKAATQGDKAASLGQRDNAGSAANGRLAAARARQSLGDLLGTRADSISQQIVLLKRLSATGDALAGSEALAVQLQVAEQEQTTTAEQAQTAYTGAIESLAQVSSRDNQELIDAMKFGIETSLADLTGAPRPQRSTAPAARSRGEPDADGEAAPAPPPRRAPPPPPAAAPPKPAQPQPKPKAPPPPPEEEE